MSAVTEVGNEREYAKLLTKALPHVIHTEEENARATAVLETLLGKRNRTREEKQLAELLTLLIEGKRAISKNAAKDLAHKFGVSVSRFL